MEFDTYDVIYAKILVSNGSHIQSKARPFVVCQNSLGCINAPTLVVMPLTSIIKKMNMPTHEIIKKDSDNGLNDDSMILGEQVYTIDKKDVMKKFGHINNKDDQNKVCKCFIANLYGKMED